MSIGEFSEIYTEAPKLFTAPDFSLFGGAEGFDEGRGDKCKRSPRRTFATQEQDAGDRYVYPAPPQNPKDFLWLMTEEPHRTRRMAIMKAHPEVSVDKLATSSFSFIYIIKVTKLMGHEPLTKYVVLLVVLLQTFLAILLRHTSPLSFTFIFCAYVIGGTANHNLFLAIHEITHNLAFKGITPNKLIAIFANLPIGIPYSAAFKVRLLSLPCVLTHGTYV